MSGKSRRAVLKNVRAGHNMFERSTEEAVKADRRPLLKGLAISVGSALGVSNTATAGSFGQNGEIPEKVESAMEGYKTRSGVNRAIQEYGNQLLEDVSKSGYLESTDLQIHGVKPHSAPGSEDPNEGTYVSAFEDDGQFIAHISIVRKTPSVVVRFNIQPQAGNAFATIKTRGGELITIANSSVEDGVSTQKFCETEYTCPPSQCCSLCDKQQTHEKTCCTYSDGSTSCTEEPISDSCCEAYT